MAWRDRKRQPPDMTREQALACIPVRNSAVTWRRLDHGLVQIEYALGLRPFLRSVLERFVPARSREPTRKLELDELGSEVWDLLDGSNTTADIIKAFASRHHISIQEAEQSVTSFLHALGRRGLIALR